MINENLKNVINNLMYAESEKDLKILLFRNLKDLTISNDMTEEEYTEIKSAFIKIAEYLSK